MNSHQPRPSAQASVDVRGDLADYEEIVQIVEHLPLLVREKRRRMRLSLRDVEQLSGVGYSTLSRFERGETVQASALVALLRWVGGLAIPPARDGHATDDS